MKDTTIFLEIKTPVGMKEIELRLTRLSVIKAERKGILDMNKSRTSPTTYIYDLAYAAVLSQIPNVTQECVDEALDRWFDATDDNGYRVNTLQKLGEVLSEQYTSLFGISESTEPA